MPAFRKNKRKHLVATSAFDIEVRPVTPQDWGAIQALFGERGACGGCWCMWWRVPRGGKLWEGVKGAKNRASLERLVKTGGLHAVMAFAENKPVGWCSFGPRDTFPRLDTVRALKRDRTHNTWSIVCFYIHPEWRQRRIATKLLEAATVRAMELGAEEVEGYPVVPKTESSIPAAFAWTGVPAMFRTAGFKQLDRPQESRPIFLRKSSSSGV